MEGSSTRSANSSGFETKVSPFGAWARGALLRRIVGLSCRPTLSQGVGRSSENRGHWPLVALGKQMRVCIVGLCGVIGLGGDLVLAEEDRFEAYKKQSEIRFDAFRVGLRQAWEQREAALDQTWVQRRQALIERFRAVETGAKGNPLKLVDTQTGDLDHLSQSQVDFAAGLVQVDVVTVAPTATAASLKAEKLAQQTLASAVTQILSQTSQEVPNPWKRLRQSYDEKEKFTVRLPDGQVEARIRIEQPINGKHSLSSALFQQDNWAPRRGVQNESPQKWAVDWALQNGPFTGLVLDALLIEGGRPSLIPTVVSEDGTYIYGPTKVDKEKAINGMAQWVSSEAALKRLEKLGNRPIIIKVIQVLEGDRYVIGQEDGERLIAADSGFLAACRVAVLMD